MNFTDYPFSPSLLKAIQAANYSTPTPIQAKSIPHVLEGKDVLGLAQTGTGKTAAFVLPMLHRFLPGPRGLVRGLIIAPTRELAEQIHKTIVTFGKNTGLKSVTIYGGVSLKGQVDALKRGVDIIVACPGRLVDHIKQGNVQFSHLEVLVLDEADHMFDMGFLPHLKQIIQRLPQKRQTLLFSATMPEDIRKLSIAVLKNHVTVEVEHTKPKEAICHTFYPVKAHLKTELLIALLQATRTGAVLIFTRTKHRAKSIDLKLQKQGFKSVSIQGNLSQNKRQAALNGFKDGKFDLMVATDIAARGLDISQVTHVINYDMPDTFEAYTHRIGRTGRASKTGDAFTIVSSEDHEMQALIQKKLGAPITIKELENFNYNMVKPLGQPEFERPSRDPRYKKRVPRKPAKARS